MNKIQIIISMMMCLFFVSCSQSTKKTSANLKLNLSGIVNSTTGIGSGGAILFGKSSTGEQFGKVISGAEENLELTNGDWSFYAVMWDKTSIVNMKDTVYCGKSAQKLSGVAVSVSLNLTNANCTDTDFSNGNHYNDTTTSKVRFPKFVLEECDDLTKGNAGGCLLENQGSALSYKMVFKSYKKSASGEIVFANESLGAGCMPTTGGSTIFGADMQVNFPLSSSAMPFVMTTEMYMGTSDCGETAADLKGVYTYVYKNGLTSSSSADNTLVTGTNKFCDNLIVSGKDECVANMGYWTGSTCQLSNLATSAFMPVSNCSASVNAAEKYTKQMVAIPKSFLCRFSDYTLNGTAVFPGGNGSINRPYKICNEWQLNQIGEQFTTSNSLNYYSYKLMNDLDMNNADFNGPARPTCAGATDSIYDKHHNLNPIGQLTVGGCTNSQASAAMDYSGTFNGNNKTISNGRIMTTIPFVGFVRSLGTNGVIKNLTFNNLQVEGDNYIGGVAGMMNGTSGVISNITINGGHVEGQTSNVGGAVGSSVNSNTLTGVKVVDVKVKGTANVGGLIGVNYGAINLSMYRGKISQHTTAAVAVGGLVGLAGSGSLITRSFSEGQIEAYAKYVGGIAGTNEGIIGDVYSTMFVMSNYQADGAQVAGIAGGSTGTINNVYSDGVQVVNGGANGVSGVVDGITPSTSVAPTNCFSTSTITTSPCSVVNATALRGGTTLLNGSVEWKANIAGARPALISEFTNASRACLDANNLLTLSAQIAAGRGTTSALPILICSADQLKDLNVIAAGKFLELADDINIKEWNATNFIPTFAGILNGKNHSLYGLTVSASPTGNMGIFKNNTGAVSNLSLVGINLTHNSTGQTGLLAGVNNGVLKNISILGSSISSAQYTGLVVGTNSATGVIDGVTLNQSTVKGTEYVGGVAGSNMGGITHASANVNMSELVAASAFSKFGGITGFNGQDANVSQSVSSANINFGSVSTETQIYTGGLVGYNSGNLENSMTKNYTQINVKNSGAVGGLAGLNMSTGSIIKSFSLGRILFNGVALTSPAQVSQLAGYNSGVIDSNTFFLENNTASIVGSAQSTQCNSSQADFTTANPSYLTLVSPGADLMVNASTVTTNSNALSTLRPFSMIGDHLIALDAISACVNGNVFNFYKSYEASSTGKKTIADFSSMATFTNYDIAFDSGNASTEKNVLRLIAYYKSKMYGTPPLLTPPIWQMDDEGHPRLLQIDD